MMELDEAKKLLEDDKKSRQEKCLAEIAEVLRKYDCTLTPVVQIAPK